MRYNKNKQEAAIYIFTIVTIIFLPISTVASVLGMNTNDIRNMDEKQWLFWATALPLTAVVIIISLFAAGILAWPFTRVVNLPWMGDETESGSSRKALLEFMAQKELTRKRKRKGRRESVGSSDNSSFVDD